MTCPVHLTCWSIFREPVKAGHFLSHPWTEECPQVSSMNGKQGGDPA